MADELHSPDKPSRQEQRELDEATTAGEQAAKEAFGDFGKHLTPQPPTVATGATPRSDEQARVGLTSCEQIVDASFARQLERELAAEKLARGRAVMHGTEMAARLSSTAAPEKEGFYDAGPNEYSVIYSCHHRIPLMYERTNAARDERKEK